MLGVKRNVHSVPDGELKHQCKADMNAEERRWTRNVQNLINTRGLKFPKLNAYYAGGSYGAIFTTTNGRVVKITPGNASFEFDALKRLRRTGFVPRAYQKAVVHLTGTRIMRNLFVNASSANRATLYVMNKIKGKQLSKYIQNGGRWGPSEKRRLRRIVHVMHSKGVIHGDFHTENILVTLNRNGTIKKFYVIDFGQGMFKPRRVRTANAIAALPNRRNTIVRSNTPERTATTVTAHGPKWTRNNLTMIQACVGPLARRQGCFR